MATSLYMETSLKLDSLDLANIETLITARMKEIRVVLVENDSPNGVVAMLGKEQLAIYRETLKKIRAARNEITAKSNSKRASR